MIGLDRTPVLRRSGREAQSPAQLQYAVPLHTPRPPAAAGIECQAWGTGHIAAAATREECTVHTHDGDDIGMRMHLHEDAKRHYALHLVLCVVPSIVGRVLRAVTSPSTHRRKLREGLDLYAPALSTQGEKVDSSRRAHMAGQAENASMRSKCVSNAMSLARARQQLTWSSVRCQWKRFSLCSASVSSKRFRNGTPKKCLPQSSSTPRQQKRGASVTCTSGRHLTMRGMWPALSNAPTASSVPI